MKARLAVVAAACLLLSPAPLRAHHSFAADFDAKRPVRLEGVVTKVEWTNPHVQILMDVRGLDGKVVPWIIEAGSPNALLRRGFAKTSVSAGAQVIIEGYQAKSGSHWATGRDIILPGGQKLFLSSDGAGAR